MVSEKVEAFKAATCFYFSQQSSEFQAQFGSVVHPSPPPPGRLVARPGLESDTASLVIINPLTDLQRCGADKR